ncbi:uncharacterized protein LOC114313965 [Camellia sinensis]|uniref:uncharacterized protein LOC114313965 n=1 Tax=Camellia sinensis TaxID=4442 RepID=UPI001035EF1A|nr:uncharacterized protein LOC114313965 [Camellia sinensis]
MYYKMFLKLDFMDSNLLPSAYPLFGFKVNPEYPLGKVTVAIRTGTKTLDMEFLVVKLPSSYNIIMRRTWLHAIQAVSSTYHQLLRFPTQHGIKQIRGSQKSAKDCYLTTSDKKSKELEVNSIEILDRENLEDVRKLPIDKAIENLVQIQFGHEPNIFFLIGACLNFNERQELISFLVNNSNVFAWTPYEMPGVDPIIVQHRLNVDLKVKPIIQKSRQSAAEHTSAIVEEVDKLLEASAIREVNYPTWLSNTVVVKKKNGSWGVCMDFTNLNKACPKDCFPSHESTG